MSTVVRQLPVKSLRWTVNLALSAFLTWTALNYFIQPGELVDAVRRLSASLKRLAFKVAINAGGRPAGHTTAIHISNTSF